MADKTISAELAGQLLCQKIIETVDDAVSSTGTSEESIKKLAQLWTMLIGDASNVKAGRVGGISVTQIEVNADEAFDALLAIYKG